MWKVGDMVRCGADGVCKIEDRQILTLMPGVKKEYFILKPVYSEGTTVYMEIQDAQNRFRAPLTKDEADAMIDAIPESERRLDGPDHDAVQVGSLLRDGALESLMGEVSILYQRGVQRRKQGKDHRAADIQNLRRAETAIYRDLASSLGIRPEEVSGYIKKRLGK